MTTYNELNDRPVRMLDCGIPQYEFTCDNKSAPEGVIRDYTLKIRKGPSKFAPALMLTHGEIVELIAALEEAIFDEDMLLDGVCPICEGNCPITGVENKQYFSGPDGTSQAWTEIRHCDECGRRYFFEQST